MLARSRRQKSRKAIYVAGKQLPIEVAPPGAEYEQKGNVRNMNIV